MTDSQRTAADEPPLAARIAQVKALISASDSHQARPLAEAVGDKLQNLWENGGRKGDTKPGLRPERIYLRPLFMQAGPTDDRGPVLPRLIKSRGLQLRLELLLLFDAQCRHKPGHAVHNVRDITPGCDDTYASWRQLVLASTVSTKGRGRPEKDLRALQITEALRALEEHHLVSIPRKPGSSRRQYDNFHLLSEASRPDEDPEYIVPEPENGVALSRHFFTNLWVFALTDTELATFLVLSWLRSKFPAKHATDGVFLTNDDRKKIFWITPTTWRSTVPLHRFRLIDKMPDERRDYRTGNVNGDFKKMWKNRDVPPTRFMVNDQALERPALQTIRQVLTAPTEDDGLRRDGREGVSVAAELLPLPTAASIFFGAGV